MEDFQVIIDSLGNSSLSFMSSAGLKFVRIYSDETDRTAHIEICLVDDTWEKRTRAIHGMVEIREMFIDDLSLDYSFVQDDDSLSGEDRSAAREFALA